MFANIQNKLDMLETKLDSITKETENMFTQMRTRRKRKIVVDEYYCSKKTNVNHQSTPVSGNIPHSNPQMSVLGTSHLPMGWVY
jgi:hypothetical protein